MLDHLAIRMTSAACTEPTNFPGKGGCPYLSHAIITIQVIECTLLLCKNVHNNIDVIQHLPFAASARIRPHLYKSRGGGSICMSPSNA